MKTEKYISQLLYRYQCVTVPEFGAFLTEVQSSHWNKNANAFFPPKKLISFNSQIKNNDGLLANHFAQAEKISYEEAVIAVKNEVADWKRNIELNKKISLKNIGNLSLNAEDNLVFVPFEQLNYLKESFGLTSFIAPVIKREIYKEELQALEAQSPILLVSESRKKSPYLKYAAILVLALSATGSVGFKLYQDKSTSDSLLVETAVQKQVQNKIQEATFFISYPVSSAKNEKMPYHIVAGAFRKEENAEKIYQDLNNKGFKAIRIPQNNNGLYPVLYGSYPTYTEAQKAMTEIQKTNNPDAWLLIEEL